ncbi:MAG: PKD domain-containing protein [Bacteroidetes bacterium]|nr:PKD domain-containing protein [Bacteroidota bacterium]
MKKINLIFIFIFCNSWIFAQTNLISYEYWFNNDYANKKVVPIAPAAQHQLNADIDASDLPDGVNIFNIRYKDENNTFSSTLSKVFYKNTEVTVSDKNLVEYEYWFNNDYGNKQVVPITPAPNHQLNAEIDASDLSDGVNVFNIRYRDENHVFSSTLSKVFYKNTEVTVSDKNLVEYEYWFNNDYGNKQVVPITPAPNHQLNAEIDASDLSDGVNVFNIRYRDENYVFSSTLSRVFYKNTEVTLSDKNLVGFEWWFNNDYQNKQVVPITPSTQHQLITDLDVSVLPEGVNVFSIRYKDENNVFSSTMSKVFYKKNPNQVGNNKITAYQYWFDDDFANAVLFTFETPVKQVNILNDLDMTQIPKGSHILNFQVMDTVGLWSVVTTSNVDKISLPIASFEISAITYCDSTTISTIDNSIDGDVYLWDFGDGTTSEEQEPSHTFFSPGNYIISLTVTDTTLWSDSTLTMPFMVESGTSYASFDAEACDSYVSPSGLYTWTESGTYYDTITNTIGCDSIITVNLTILESTYSTIAEEVCDSYTSPSGNYTWDVSGVYSDTIPNAAGCDSVININLTIHYTAFAEIDASTCEPYISPSGIYIWEVSGTYNDTITTLAGCDSILTINLTVVEVDTSVTVTDPVLTANAEGANYQWLLCPSMEPIEGATEQSYTATENGWYAVEVTQNECTDTSSCFQILTVGMHVPLRDVISVFPNPTSGLLHVDFGEMVSEIKLILRNSTGAIVSSHEILNTSNATLELKGGQGLYFLEVIQSDSRITVFKVMKE